MENEHPETTPVQASPTPPVTPQPLESQYSEFDGTTLQLLGWRLLGILLSIVTLGIATPWAQCMIYRWETKHTLVEGKRLRFDGTGLQLLGNYLLWGLLTLITLGIFTIFLPVQMNQWRASHTKFADEKNPPEPVSGWAIAAAVLASLLVLTLAGGGLYLYTDKHPAQPDRVTIFQQIEDAFSKPQKEETPVLPQGGHMIIQDGDSVIIWHEEISEPTEYTVPEGIQPPRTDDDGDYWYVDAHDGMNVRSGPDASSTLLRRLPHGAEVQVLDWENGWAFLGDGWIAGNYLQVNRPKDAIDPETAIQGKWVFLAEKTQGYDESYYAVVFQFNADGTFQSETAIVSYSNIGGSMHWIPDGSVKNTAFQGTYTYDGEDLDLDYLEEDDNDFAVWKRVDAEAYWDGQKMDLEDYKGIPLFDKDETRYEAGKRYPVLLPMDDDADMEMDLCDVVSRYIKH